MRRVTLMRLDFRGWDEAGHAESVTQPEEGLSQVYFLVCFARYSLLTMIRS